MPSKTLLGLAGLVALVAAAKDLGTVLKGNSDLSTYYDLIQKYPDILLQLPSYDGVTIIAPSNDAFKNVPYTALNGIWNPDDKETTVPLLQYHILQGTVLTGSLPSGPTIVRPTLLTDPRYTNVTSGQNVLIDIQPGNEVIFTTSLGTRCTVTDADISFQGGLIQVVDNLLIPPAPLNVTVESFKLPNFLGALYASDLMPEIQDAKNITVFAPLDKALDIVGGSLDKMDAHKLARIMGYHIVPGKVLVSSALTNGSRFPTLASNTTQESITVRQSGNNKYINSAQIVQPDILLANGILHIISDVLNPDANLAIPNPTAVTQPPVFPVSTVKNAFTSALPCTTDCPVTTTADNSTIATTTATSLWSSSSKAGAAQAMATAHVMAGAALGMIGVGAGMVLM
ncbi:Fasciclin-like arabinogalactan protein [Cladobotryum mycophilum]|uniref:Fasciclin-like arabinogalactan protein n=1 Tax=Cladobotryum mycophilum TaxID=491253 RepID=A0ABR0SH82_9HYPO